ncbi:hypothetical protein C2S53_005814 [Perilla frutescens var. hirtella]|uniref:Uncharacterized protein n=1 Tax=Perilla frutescens var. hirtella TaxID=608512 RepID=A0AAD4P9H3_PERFH|nr:hypothetical protein C2S53_005814 [Perilla frutescens var. hirtella]
MEATAHHFCALTPKIGAFRPNILPFPVHINNRRNASLKKEILKVKKCAKGDSAWKEKIVDELNLEEELKKLNSKCGGGVRGIVELLECLEREAIMGEDEGREPTDYNRRALIFDRSSRVFQALKKQSETTSSSCV